MRTAEAINTPLALGNRDSLRLKSSIPMVVVKRSTTPAVRKTMIPNVKQLGWRSDAPQTPLTNGTSMAFKSHATANVERSRDYTLFILEVLRDGSTQ